MSTREEGERGLVAICRGQLACRSDDRTADEVRLRTLAEPPDPCHSVRVPRHRGDRRWDHWRRWAFRGVDILREHQTLAGTPVEIGPPPRVNKCI